MVRSSYNEGFHAPNLAQLFTGTLIRTVTGSTDTYRSPVTGLTTDGPSNRRSVASGNRNLTPETSKGKSAGIVLEIPRVKGLSVSVDLVSVIACAIIFSETYSIQAWFSGGLPFFLVKFSTKVLEAGLSRV